LLTSKDSQQASELKDFSDDELFEFDSAQEMREDDSLCKLVGIDIEKRL